MMTDRLETEPGQPCTNHTAKEGQASGWCHFQHAADIGVCGWGTSLSEAFEQAAVAMTAVMVNPGHVAERSEVIVRCEAPDRELLLVDWLNALVYEMATRGLVFHRFRVGIDGQRLEGRAWGEPINPKRHHPVVEVKGATYTALSVTQTGGTWRACCVVDV